MLACLLYPLLFLGKVLGLNSLICWYIYFAFVNSLIFTDFLRETLREEETKSLERDLQLCKWASEGPQLKLQEMFSLRRETTE